MSRIIVVPEAVLPQLISAAEVELCWQKHLYEKLEEDCWPADFDAHDILILEDVLKELGTARSVAGGTAAFPYWRGMQPLMRLVQKDGESSITFVDEAVTAHSEQSSESHN
jgi:hypothetical protein